MEKREEMYHLKKVKKMVHLQAAVDLKLEDNPSLSLFFFNHSVVASPYELF